MAVGPGDSEVRADTDITRLSMNRSGRLATFHLFTFLPWG